MQGRQTQKREFATMGSAAERRTQQRTFQKRSWVVRFRPESATQMHGNKQDQSKHHRIHHSKHRTTSKKMTKLSLCRRVLLVGPFEQDQL